MLEVVASSHKDHGCAGPSLANAAQELTSHVSDAGEHVTHLSSALGYPFLLGRCWLALSGLFFRALRWMSPLTQLIEHRTSLGTGVAFLARITDVKHFVKVMPVMLTGCAHGNPSDKIMLVIKR